MYYGDENLSIPITVGIRKSRNGRTVTPPSMSNDEQSQHKQKHPEEESPARGIANGDVYVQSGC